MIRVLSLVSAILLAGCTTVAMEPAPPPQVAGIGIVSLSFLGMDDVPEHVEELFEEAFDHRAFFHRIDFERRNGTVGIVGYMSVVSSGAGTLVVYVFDFVDRAGNRLLRVGGREITTAAPENPWDVITEDFAEDLAEEALDEFDDWLDDNRVGV